MTKHLLLFLLLSGTAFACKEKSGGHLTTKQMEDVMMDISIAESYSTMARDNNHPMGLKNPDSLAIYYRDVFAHHHITQEQFKSSLAWYKKHSENLDSIYNKVSARVDKALEEETVKMKIRDSVKADSVKKANVLAKPDSVKTLSKKIKPLKKAK